MDKFSELKSAAEKYSLTLNAHRENPRDIDAIRAWDEADAELSRVISLNETDIIIALLAEHEASQEALKNVTELWNEQRQRIVDLEAGEKILESATLKHLARAEEAEKRLATLAITSADSDPQREHFGCNVRTTESGTFYVTKLGSVPGREFALYRNEAESLFIGLGEALGSD